MSHRIITKLEFNLRGLQEALLPRMPWRQRILGATYSEGGVRLWLELDIHEDASAGALDWYKFPVVVLLQDELIPAGFQHVAMALSPTPLAAPAFVYMRHQACDINGHRSYARGVQPGYEICGVCGVTTKEPEPIPPCEQCEYEQRGLLQFCKRCNKPKPWSPS